MKIRLASASDCIGTTATACIVFKDLRRPPGGQLVFQPPSIGGRHGERAPPHAAHAARRMIQFSPAGGRIRARNEDGFTTKGTKNTKQARSRHKGKLVARLARENSLAS